MSNLKMRATSEAIFEKFPFLWWVRQKKMWRMDGNMLNGRRKFLMKTNFIPYCLSKQTAFLLLLLIYIWPVLFNWSIIIIIKLLVFYRMLAWKILRENPDAKNENNHALLPLSLSNNRDHTDWFDDISDKYQVYN